MAPKQTLYTQTLDTEQAAQTRRIRARHGTQFRTRILCDEAAKDSGAGMKWYEARQIDEHGALWTVDSYETAPDIYSGYYEDEACDNVAADEIAIKINEIHSNICFFDALHLCAVFEVTGIEQGLRFAANGGLQKSSVPHFRPFALREGQPFDKATGLPVPSANGRRLCKSGTFGTDLNDVLARAQDNLLPEDQVKAAFLKSVMAKGQPGYAPSPDDHEHTGQPEQALVRPAEKSKALQEHTQAARDEKKLALRNKNVLGSNIGSLRMLRKRFNKAVQRGFKVSGSQIAEGLKYSSVGSLGFGVGGLGLYGLYTASAPLWAGIPLGAMALGLAGIGGLFMAGGGITIADAIPNVAMSYDRKALRKAVNKLEGPLKDAAAQMEKDIAIGYASLQYRQAARVLAQGGGFLARRKHTKELKRLYECCSYYGMDGPETARFVDGLDQDLQDRDFDRNIYETLDHELKELTKHIVQLEKQDHIPDLKKLPVPAKEPKP